MRHRIPHTLDGLLSISERTFDALMRKGKMCAARRHLRSMFLVVALVTPQTVRATNAPQQERHDVSKQQDGKDGTVRAKVKRVYDRAHHDYHNWDQNEDKAYRQYLTDRHRNYLPLSKLSHNEQRAY